MRNVSLAHVLVKIRFTDGIYYLLHKNKKWGDWNLVGGHVEPGEEGEWARTAYRETEEEMSPLRYREDFILVPLLAAPILFGPRSSRSSQGQLTQYKAQFFRLVFRSDPLAFLKQLNDDFQLVPESEVAQRDDVGALVKELDQRLRGGIVSVPPAWQVPSARQVTTRTHTAPAAS